MSIGKNRGAAWLLPAAVLLTILCMVSAPAPAPARDVLLAWEKLDGAAAGYKVYWGQSSRAYDFSADAGTRTEFIIRGLQDGITYYFATTAYDSSNNESEFSREAVIAPSTAPSGISGAGGNCFIATAAYGSNLAPEIEALRGFRDEYLMTNPAGRLLVNAYYSISPPLADFIRDSNFLKAMTRWILSPLVYAINHPLTALLLIALTAAGSLACGRMAGAVCGRRASESGNPGDPQKG